MEGRWRSLPSAETGVAVLGNLLVGLLGDTAGGGLNLVSDEVAGVLDGIHFDDEVGFVWLMWCLFV